MIPDNAIDNLLLKVLDILTHNFVKHRYFDHNIPLFNLH